MLTLSWCVQRCQREHAGVLARRDWLPHPPEAPGPAQVEPHIAAFILLSITTFCTVHALCPNDCLASSTGETVKTMWCVPSSCQLSTVPGALGQLTACTRMSLHNNGLIEVPSDIGNMASLQWLCASDLSLPVLSSRTWCQDLSIYNARSNVDSLIVLTSATASYV